MQRAARDTNTTTRLLGHLERATTGRLSVGEGATEVSVYVLNGDIVAARSGNDDHQLIRRLWAGQVIDIARVAALEAMAELGESVFGVLLEEVEPDLMEVVLFERFRDNLATFLGNPEEPRFTEMTSVFVDNIQMGHDSHRLAADCAKLWRKAEAVDPEMGIVPAHPEDAAGEQLLVMEALGAGRNVRAVLDDVPLEPVWARAMIAGMLDTGIVASSDIEPPDTSEMEATFEVASQQSEPEVPASSEFAATEIIEGARPFIRPADAPTLETEIIERPKPKARKLGEVIAEKKSKPEEPRKRKKGKKAKEEEQLPELDVEPEPDFEDDEPTVDSSRPIKVPDVRELLPADDEPLEVELELELDEDEPVPDEAVTMSDEAATVTDEDLPAPEEHATEPDEDATEPDEDATEPDVDDGTAEAPLDLDVLLRPGGGVDVDDNELDLDAFADHDTARGGDAEGAFSTDTHNLDRVEVDMEEEEEEAPDDDEELIEADEAPHAMFSGRLLSEDEAAKKIDVANQAVVEVIQAFDASEGAGRGRATMQIVLDGSPQRFAVLFQGVKLGDGDELPAMILMRNLHERPQTEHRQLLNQGLVDLIERALSLAMDEITDDTAIDTLLERTAGYRQRIGL